MDEAERLQSLLDACREILPGIENRDDQVAEAIRATCRDIEARLRELGVTSATRS
jgi:hypothetical protein